MKMNLAAFVATFIVVFYALSTWYGEHRVYRLRVEKTADARIHRPWVVVVDTGGNPVYRHDSNKPGPSWHPDPLLYPPGFIAVSESGTIGVIKPTGELQTLYGLGLECYDGMKWEPCPEP